MVAMIRVRPLCSEGCGRRPYLYAKCCVCRHKEDSLNTRHGPPPAGYDGGFEHPGAEERVRQLAKAYEETLRDPRADTNWHGPSWVELLPWPDGSSDPD